MFRVQYTFVCGKRNLLTFIFLSCNTNETNLNLKKKPYDKVFIIITTDLIDPMKPETLICEKCTSDINVCTSQHNCNCPRSKVICFQPNINLNT